MPRWAWWKTSSPTNRGSGTYITVCHLCLQVPWSLKQNSNGWVPSTWERLGFYHLTGLGSSFNYTQNYCSPCCLLVLLHFKVYGLRADNITRYLNFIFYVCGRRDLRILCGGFKVPENWLVIYVQLCWCYSQSCIGFVECVHIQRQSLNEISLSLSFPLDMNVGSISGCA